MDKKGFRIFLLTIGTAMAGCLTACISNSEDESLTTVKDPEVAVSFAPSVGAEQTIRSTYPDSKGAIASTDDLKKAGFGVFAYYSGNDVYQYDSDKSGKNPFNFMWNQQVSWANTYWTYSPLKYWPNDNKPADHQGATGSQARSYLSFFAYAPYTDYKETTATDDGIVAFTANSVASGASYLTYRMSNDKPFLIDENIDLLWATRPNLWKMMNSGEGYVDGQVQFNFKHALSKFTITVQGIFDHRNNDDHSTDYPDDIDQNTRIMVESVDFQQSPLMKEGNMYLVPRPNATSPYWELNKKDAIKLSIKDYDINYNIRDTYNFDKKYDRDYFPMGVDADSIKALFDKLPTGVTHTEVSLFEQPDFYYLVIPNKGYVTDNDPMKVHIVYHVITYDPNLKLNNPPYCSIVKNDITASFSDSFAFEPNKQYKLRLLLGLTTVKFELEEAEGWETPLVMDPVVIDWHVEKREFNVEDYDKVEDNDKE